MEGNINKLSNGLTVSIDWLSFTITELSCVSDVLGFLGYSINDFDDMEHGGKGYRSGICLSGFDGFSVLFDGKEDMGIHVDISGSVISEVLRSFKSSLEIDTPFGKGYDIDFNSTFLCKLLSIIRKYGHVTRLDLAIDDYGGNYFTPDDINDFHMQGRIVSKFRMFENRSTSIICGEKVGHTINFGKRVSDIMLRIYDKRLEQNSRKKASVVTEPWIRWEIEFKKERAVAIANMIECGMNLGDIAVGVLSEYVRFINLDNANKSRCSVNKDWLLFLNNVRKLKLVVASPDKTLDDKKIWIEKQVLPTLIAIFMADGGSLEFIENRFDSGIRRMKKPLRDLVIQHLGYNIFDD